MTDTVVVVTGASRGFGLAVAQSFATGFENADIVLVGRSLDALKAAAATPTIANRDAAAALCAHTLYLSPDYPSSDILNKMPRKIASYSKVILVHNAGTLGTIGRLRDADSVQDSLQVNLIAPMQLTDAVLKACYKSCETRVKETVIINVSSLCALQPFDAMGSYCIGKAAREMYFRNLALEEVLIEKEEKGVSTQPAVTHTKHAGTNNSKEFNSRVKVLNYAPGPMATDMQRQLRENLPDSQLRDGFKEMFEVGNLVEPNDSARVLFKIIEDGNYESGCHLDYYDVKDRFV
ncbi:hypothetical protein BC830DRAFT_1163698 [Chytriomyces sp. MP71]|nr:hypothetical protein BC830DRAFT_1163698 [Chytriomyces sp. MP71]